MPTNPIPTPSLPVALRSLREPIESFAPRTFSDARFQGAMLGLSGYLEELWSEDEDETLESDIVWTALYAFPALTVLGPAPDEMVEWTVEGVLMDVETAETLCTLKMIREILRDFEPPGFAAALWRQMLLAIYAMIELLVIVDDQRNIDRCFELLDTAEAMADRFSGVA